MINKILTLDVALGNTGWVLWRNNSGAWVIEDFGVIHTEKGTLENKMRDDRERIESLLKMLNSDQVKSAEVIVAEFPFGSQSNTAARAMALATSAVISFSYLKEKLLFNVTPAAVKKVVGDKDAEKNTIMSYVQGKYRLFSGLPKYKFEHIADAVCVFEAFSKTEDFEILTNNSLALAKQILENAKQAQIEKFQVKTEKRKLKKKSLKKLLTTSSL